jgi:membrane protease YdiL (CAAX protease family)
MTRPDGNRPPGIRGSIAPEGDARVPVGRGEFIKPLLAGSAVAIAGVAPWTILGPLNGRIRPELPWAALGTAIFLMLFIAWLNGAGWPRGTSRSRRRSLRLWPPAPDPTAGSVPVLLIVLLLALLYLLWVLVGRPDSVPDLSAYPTTSYRFSVFIMGAVVSGVVEEAAFRGYMQRNLERWGPEAAIVVTSVVFTLFHGVHGLQTLLLLGPGFFAASVLYGVLAWRTGTILPGMAIHTLGDLAYSYFGILGGNGALLFVS